MKCLLVFSLLVLFSCTNDENISNDTEEIPDSTYNDESIKRIDYTSNDVEFIDSHEEATFHQGDSINTENISFEIDFESDVQEDTSNNQLVIRIAVEENEELIIGSTHFRLEYYNGEEWEQIEGVPYGDEDAQAIITLNQPFEITFSNINQFDTDFDDGNYRFVNSGYVFPFEIIVVN